MGKARVSPAALPSLRAAFAPSERPDSSHLELSYFSQAARGRRGVTGNLGILADTPKHGAFPASTLLLSVSWTAYVILTLVGAAGFG